MSDQVIKQPDGLLAVWSTVVDDWTLFDATAAELADHYAAAAAAEARARTATICDQVEGGTAHRIYHQFTMTFDQAQQRRGEQHGSAPWPPEEAGR